MDPFIPALTQFGGLGVLALFAYILLKSVLKQQEKLADLLDNHLRSLLDRQDKSNALLAQMLKQMEAHEARALTRQEQLLAHMRGNQ